MGGINPNLDFFTTNPIRWNGRTSTKEDARRAVNGEKLKDDYEEEKNKKTYKKTIGKNEFEGHYQKSFQQNAQLKKK